ncbi:MAG: hypothetical protein OEY89_11470 [Gammaproteobacteria bacterium]|nr:hypothetical protein [Gammaproteobacteria bacterium]
MTESDESNQPGARQHVHREKLGLLDGEPKAINSNIDSLSPHQQELRQVVINNFKAKKLKQFVSKQVQYINANRQIANAVRFLFDKDGRPPGNVPIEDIIEERKKIETEIRWLNAIVTELSDSLSKIKEIEEEALELIGQNPEDYD